MYSFNISHTVDMIKEEKKPPSWGSLLTTPLLWLCMLHLHWNFFKGKRYSNCMLLQCLVYYCSCTDLWSGRGNADSGLWRQHSLSGWYHWELYDRKQHFCFYRALYTGGSPSGFSLLKGVYVRQQARVNQCVVSEFLSVCMYMIQQPKRLS